MDGNLSIEILENTPANIHALQQLSVKTFLESFGEQNTAANMQLYLNENLTYNKLVDEINHPDAQFFIVKAELIPVGYLKINFSGAQTDIKDENGLEIERIYVLKDYQNRKIGQLLFDKAMQIAKDHSMQYLWLGVWEKNLKAINFYKRNGLLEFDTHVFKLGNDEQTDILMKIELK